MYHTLSVFLPHILSTRFHPLSLVLLVLPDSFPSFLSHIDVYDNDSTYLYKIWNLKWEKTHAICVSKTGFIHYDYLHLHPFFYRWHSCFFFPTEASSILSYTHAYLTVLLPSACDAGCLGWFPNLAIVPGAAINTGEQVSLWYVNLEPFG